jgi:hypothetical protein
MSIFFLNIIFTNLFYLILGKFLITKLFNLDFKTPIDYAIMGIIGTSFFALLINFFFPLNLWVNSIFYAVLIIIFITFKLNIKKNEFLFIIIASLLVFLLIIYDTEYRPDGGLYHIPYTQILNENKIIIGLSNLHSRYAHISIIQYLSAFNYNILGDKNGIFIPLGSLIIFLYIYFLNDILRLINKKDFFSFGKLFSIIVIIYVSYKINRYSEFGNDAPAHLFLLFLISKFIYFKNNSSQNIYLIYCYSAFAFLNKIFFIFIFLIPFYMFLEDKKKFKSLILSFPTTFILFWILKNILISGCAIFPMEKTCINSLKWTNIELVKKAKIEGEAWSKAWPQNKNIDLNMVEFSKNFNWFDAWVSVHLKYIIKILLPFLIVLFLIYLFLNAKNKINENIYKIKINDGKFIILIIISILGIVSFFLMYPIYRYGYSYIILFIFIFFTAIFNKIDKKKFFILSKTIILISLITFVSKQSLRILKFFNERNFIPNYIFIDKKNYKTKFQKIVLSKDLTIYLSEDECFYGLSPCTSNIQNINDLKSYTKLTYNFLYYK